MDFVGEVQKTSEPAQKRVILGLVTRLSLKDWQSVLPQQTMGFRGKFGESSNSPRRGSTT
jgi:hypothetical protein